MPERVVRRTRSRDGSANDPIRRPPSRATPASSMSSDQRQQEQELQEPLLIRAESSSSSPSPHHSNSSNGTTRIRLGSSNGNDLESQQQQQLRAASPSGSNRGVFKPADVLQRLLKYFQQNPESLSILGALCAWYLVGVLAICTTKWLLSTPISEGGVPSPLVLTLQQMTLGSTLLGTFCYYSNGRALQQWPKEEHDKSHHPHPHSESSSTSATEGFSWFKPSTYTSIPSQITTMLDFLLLAGLFNGLDFLASNTSFSKSSASFVETIKASEPITTTGLAIWWGIDRLGKMETFSLTILITGVLISTYANATAQDDDPTASASSPLSLVESVKTCLTVMTANLCFAFRAMAQKLLRSTVPGSAKNFSDFNLLFRMQQTGAASLVLPVLLFQFDTLYQVLLGRPSWSIFQWYVGISLVNAWAFATYSLASCYILSRISVVQHSGFGCLRRLFAIVTTSIAFHVPIHLLGAIGILMSIVGFSGFTHYRFQKQGKSIKGGYDDDNGSMVTTASTTSTSTSAMMVNGDAMMLSREASSGSCSSDELKSHSVPH